MSRGAIYGWMAASALACAVGDWASKTHRPWVALACFTLSSSIWIRLLGRGMGIGWGNVVYALGCVVVGVVLGALMFHERLSGRQWCGAVLALVALVLMKE